jgi:hypothetical protein
MAWDSVAWRERPMLHIGHLLSNQQKT